MTGNTAQNKNTMYYVHSAIFVILTFLIGFLPPFGGITPLGMKVLGVFIGVIYGWIFVGFIWPSLFAMVVLGMSGYSSVIGVFGAAFGNNIVLQCFATFVFVATMDQCGLTTYIANWCVTRKICRGKPWVLTALIFLAAFLVAGCINLYGGIIILWYIFYGICKTAGLKKGDQYVSYIIGGIVFVGTITIVSMPILPLAQIYFGLLGEAAAGYTLPVISASATGLAIVFASAALYWLVGKYVLKIDTSALKSATEELASREMEKLNKEQKLAILSLVVFVLAAALPNVLPAGALKAKISNFGILGAAAIIVTVQCFRRTPEGKPVYTFPTLVQKGINWDIIIMFAATMPISSALESSDTGIISTVVGTLMPILSNLSPIAFILVCCAIFWVATQLAHNLILVIVFLPTLASIGLQFGINPYLFALIFCMVTNCAFMTPGSSAQAAMIFGNSDWISTKDAYKYCIVFAIIALASIVCVGLPLGLMLF